MTEKEKMLSGKLYRAFDEELGVINKKSRLLLDEFNETSHTDFKKREEIIKKLFGSTKENVHINKPIYCDYGVNIHVGENFYANFNTTFLDVNKIIIGDNVLFGPNVSVYTAGHPIDPIIRREGFEFGKEVNIGNDVWVGGSVVINPGVTIGDNVVIGAGSVVVKDIPSNTVAAGNPAKVIRKIDESDYLYWQKEKEEYYK